MTIVEINNAIAAIKESNARVPSSTLDFMLEASLEKIGLQGKCEICRVNNVEMCNKHGNICNECNRKLR